jgi:hypothetical protein
MEFLARRSAKRHRYTRRAYVTADTLIRGWYNKVKQTKIVIMLFYPLVVSLFLLFYYTFSIKTNKFPFETFTYYRFCYFLFLSYEFKFNQSLMFSFNE